MVAGEALRGARLRHTPAVVVNDPSGTAESGCPQIGSCISEPDIQRKSRV
jgi:hypothetical protein